MGTIINRPSTEDLPRQNHNQKGKTNVKNQYRRNQSQPL